MAEPKVIKNRYCGSKHDHAPHVTPMIGRDHIAFRCRGKGEVRT